MPSGRDLHVLAGHQPPARPVHIPPPAHRETRSAPARRTILLQRARASNSSAAARPDHPAARRLPRRPPPRSSSPLHRRWPALVLARAGQLHTPPRTHEAPSLETQSAPPPHIPRHPRTVISSPSSTRSCRYCHSVPQCASAPRPPNRWDRSSSATTHTEPASHASPRPRVVPRDPQVALRDPVLHHPGPHPIRSAARRQSIPGQSSTPVSSAAGSSPKQRDRVRRPLLHCVRPV